MNLDALTLDFGIFTGEYAITLGLVFLGWQLSRLIKVLRGEQVRHRRPDKPGRIVEIGTGQKIPHPKPTPTPSTKETT